VDEAHKRGLSIHAWINPMRGMNDTYIKAISDKYLIKQWYNDDKKNGTYISLVNGVWYCNPAYKEVRDMITNGAKEILSKYNVDGIHIDDYFYPTTEKSFDAAAFAQSKSNNLTQWRLDTVSTMVKELYSGIKSVNPTALFGVSPQGNINNNYSTQYADVKKWCSQSGYLDYIVPQIYFGFKNKYQPYQTNMNSWCAMVTAPNVKMVVGLAPYKIGTADNTGEWQNDANILARQVETFKNSGKYGGAAFFRYESIFKPAASVKNQVNNELAALKEKLK
ncbi:MAG: family 10 glycosylhydrolase, partial [Oscillospiraceae bacterium]